jgi:hypothetical protein
VDLLSRRHLQLLHERCELLALLARVYELHSVGIAQELSAGDKENATAGGGAGTDKGAGAAAAALFSPDRFAVLLQSLHRRILRPRAAGAGGGGGGGGAGDAAAELVRLSESLVGGGAGGVGRVGGWNGFFAAGGWRGLFASAASRVPCSLLPAPAVLISMKSGCSKSALSATAQQASPQPCLSSCSQPPLLRPLSPPRPAAAALASRPTGGRVGAGSDAARPPGRAAESAAPGQRPAVGQGAQHRR